VAHEADGEEKRIERGARSAAFEGARVRGAAREKGGVWGSLTHGGENGEERGGPRCIGGQLGCRHQPLTGGAQVTQRASG
jgi:hypothetical protein